MKRNIISFSFREVCYLLLLPLFFVFHGFVENYAQISFLDALQLFLFYALVTAAICAAGFFIFRSWPKAFLFAFILMEVHFFYGSFHDGLKKLFGVTFFTSYTLLLPFVALFFILSFIFIKSTHRKFARLTNYLNTVFICLLILDAGVLGIKIKKNSYYGKNALPAAFTKCDTCQKPDVYLIVADEYAGYDELKSLFHFGNDSFQNALTQRGFHVIPHSTSNYNFTPFSIASALNLSYLPILDTNHTAHDIPKVMGMIGENILTHFFYKQGYEVFNNAIFDLPREPKQALSSFLPDKTKYITAQTLVSRVYQDLYYHIVTDLKQDWAIKEGLYNNLKANRFLYEKTIETSLKKVTPKFSYTHLSMPHWPFYFNEHGQFNPAETLYNDMDKNRYLGYLQYVNKKLLYLIDQIQKNSSTPPIIVLISDHGFRGPVDGVEKRYKFMNLCALYMPDGNYAPYYDTLSLVNLFRTILNQRFGQRLSLVNDRTNFLRD